MKHKTSVFIQYRTHIYHVKEQAFSLNRVVISSTARRTYVVQRESAEECKHMYVLLTVRFDNSKEGLHLPNVLC